MSILEIENAISRLPAAEISALRSWLDAYDDGLSKDDSLDDHTFDRLIAEAYASGEPTPLTSEDINAAREAVRNRILSRRSAE